MAREQRFFRFLQSLQSHLPGDRGKSQQKTLHAEPRFEVVKQGGHENSRAAKGGFTRHDCGIANDNRFHRFNVPRCPCANMWDMLKLTCALVAALTISPLLMRAEEYVLGPDSQRQPGVPQGTVTKYEWKSKIYPGTVRDYWVYVPAQYKP